MGNAKEFRINLGKFADQFEEDVLTATKKIAMDVLARVVQKTPVKSGRARGNWIVSIGAPDHSSIESGDKSDDGRNTVAAGTRTIDAIKEPVPIFVQNNLPYIEKLEGGSSQQAPAGMVAVTIAEIQAGFSK